MINLIFLTSMLSILFSERGDLISYTFKEVRDASTIQSELEDYISDLADTEGAQDLITPNAIYDIKLYSITYQTIDQFGEYTEASGSVALPDNYNFAYPLYLIGHGTQIRRSSAPSMGGFNLLNQWLTSDGYIYLEPDYLGLGVSEVLHPYHLKDVTASSMIDMIFAVKSLCDQLAVAQYNHQLFIAGYSEGGYAAMATVKEIEENYENLEITMSFPMAGAYDLSGTMVDLMLSEEEYADPFYLPFFILSYIEKYNLGDIDDFFKPEYANILPDLFSGEYSGSYINDFLPDIPINMMLDDMVTDFTSNPNFPFKIHLAENDLTNWSPQSPMYLLHGEADERVPVENTYEAYNSFIQNGSSADIVKNEILPPELFGIELGHQNAAAFCYIITDQYSSEVQLIISRGDINEDLQLNISDIISIINNILNYSDLDNFDFWLNDLNNDSLINIFDIVLLIEGILNE